MIILIAFEHEFSTLKFMTGIFSSFDLEKKEIWFGIGIDSDIDTDPAAICRFDYWCFDLCLALTTISIEMKMK